MKHTIVGIDENSWTAIRYPDAIYEEQTGEWISDAEVAETAYTAFESKARHRTTGRLIVRRVRRLRPDDGQAELLPAYRYHAIFTDVTFPLVEAESFHRRHAVAEQFFADLIDGPLAHLPSGRFNANAPWLQLSCTAHFLGRSLGVMASPRHAVARQATLRRELINVPARPARSGRGNLVWHLPVGWHWEMAWHNIFGAVGPPAAARRSLTATTDTAASDLAEQPPVDTPDSRPVDQLRPRSGDSDQLITGISAGGSRLRAPFR